MSRVSENSGSAALQYSLNKAKSKLEDLQMKGANLKRIFKPSDDPVGNVELMALKSEITDNKQYKRSNNFAKINLNYTDNALEDLVQIFNKAKEIAISQSSDFYNQNVRRSVAQEISQLRKSAISISNRRLANRYIFSGHATLTRPFSAEGKYQGDSGRTFLEVAKDYFVPINLHGIEVFFPDDKSKISSHDPLEGLKGLKNIPNKNQIQEGDDLANKIETETKPETKKTTDKQDRSVAGALHFPDDLDVGRESLFDILQSLENSLITSDSDAIQNLMPRLDKILDKLITARAHVGSLSNAVDNAEITLEKQNFMHLEHKSKLEDADVAELFSDLKRHQDILTATYQSGRRLIDKTLLDFIR